MGSRVQGVTLASKKPRKLAPVGLAVEGLSVARGGRTVIADVSFRLSAGQALELRGANGAGKSTLLRALAGLLPTEGGTVRLDGGPAGAALGEQTHYLGHADGLKSALSAGQNLAFAAGLFAAAGGGASAALAGLGLTHVIDLPVAYLSAGQRRRVALARLLVAPRPLWLLDEPTAALDAAAQASLAGLMTHHLATGGMIVAATHGPLGLGDTATLRLEP